MDTPGEIRISDNDRDRYNDVLKQAYAQGRITESELEDRLTTVFDARYESDLSPVVADLPQSTSLQIASPGHDDNDDRVSASISPLLAAPLICTAVYAMTDFGGNFWPMWVWFGCSIPLIGRFASRRIR